MAVDTLWVMAAAFLVFFMNAGFGCVEAGFCRAKNAVNILGKNFIVFGISSLAFWVLGWTIMFGHGNDYSGTSGLFVQGSDNSPATSSLADLVKAEITEQYGIDFDDEANEALAVEIDEEGEKARTTVREDDKEYTVTIKVAGQVS